MAGVDDGDAAAGTAEHQGSGESGCAAADYDGVVRAANGASSSVGVLDLVRAHDNESDALDRGRQRLLLFLGSGGSIRS
jgi:hypothetical protein